VHEPLYVKKINVGIVFLQEFSSKIQTALFYNPSNPQITCGGQHVWDPFFLLAGAFLFNKNIPRRVALAVI
jgi:hypothetical protein